MGHKYIYIPNNGKQKYLFCSLILLVETFNRHLLKPTNQYCNITHSLQQISAKVCLYNFGYQHNVSNPPKLLSGKSFFLFPVDTISISSNTLGTNIFQG